MTRAGQTRAGLSRELVVRTAADLADEHGLRAVTVSSVARRLGVRPPSIYSHLGGADELATEVTVLALTELADRADRALAGRSGREALTALADVHRDYARAHPGRFEAAGHLDQAVTPALAAVGARVTEQSLAVLRGYAVPEAERVHAVRFVAGLLRGWVELEGGGAFSHREPPADDSWHRALDALDAVLRTWPGWSGPRGVGR